MEASFFQNQQKAWAFEGKGFLNKYVFFMNDKEPPLMKDVFLDVSSPPQKPEKKNPKKKKKVKNGERRPTGIHMHASLHVVEQPNAEIVKIAMYLFVFLAMSKMQKI